jgi:hypothetical protein
LRTIFILLLRLRWDRFAPSSFSLLSTLEENMVRRSLLSRLAGLPFFALGASQAQAPKKLKVMMKSAWGPDDPTRAAFPFIHGLVLAEAGHDVQIFLLAEATTLLRKSMVSAIFPVGWPPLSETLQKVVDKHIPVFA